MSVSIIIPVLNESQELGKTLPPLLSDPGVLEVIVADGGSSDSSRDVATACGARVINAPCGRALQMNAAAAAARGDILLFLHADSRLPAKAIAEIKEAIDSGALWGRFNIRLSGRHWLLRVVERTINIRSCLSGIATGDQAIFLGRELFERLGGYAEIPLMEDVELSKRLRRLRWPVCIREPLITSSRRWEHYGILRTILLMWWLRLAYFLGACPASLACRYRRSDSA
jgi:rSAM/selenodomain-associated transferase 2